MSEEVATATVTETAGQTGEQGNIGVESSAPWYGELSETLKPHETFYSQFKDRDSFLKSAADTKAALSRKTEGLVKLPTADAPEEERSAFFRALGVPETPDAYEIEPPTMPEGFEWNPDSIAPSIKEAAHRSGVTPQALSALVQAQAEVEAAQIAELQAQQKAADEALVNEWGDDYDYKLGDIAQRVGDKLDLDQPFLSRVDVLRALDDLAKDFREDTTGTGRAVNSGMSLDDQIGQIRSSEEYRNTAHPKHSEVRAKLHSLYSEQARREEVAAR